MQVDKSVEKVRQRHANVEKVQNRKINAEPNPLLEHKQVISFEQR